MRKRLGWVPLLLLAGCGGEPARKAQVVAEPAAVKPTDEGRRFPTENQVQMRLLERELLGPGFAPGGNVAEYRKGRQAYKLFLTRAATAGKAGLLLFDLKGTMAEPKFVPSFGGYYGALNGQPVFAFAKGRSVAGVVGLPQADADAVARVFATRLE